MERVNNVLTGKELDNYFKKVTLELENSLRDFLSQYDPSDTFNKWRLFIKHVDELYNIDSLTTYDEDELFKNCSINICRNPYFFELLNVVGKRYGQEIQGRFMLTCQMLSLLNKKYAASGQTMNCYGTIYEAIGFCQRMRLYYTSFLLLIPKYAKGRKRVEFMYLLDEFQPVIDSNLVHLRTAYNALLINKCIDDFCVTPNEFGLAFNYTYNHLEDDSLEPVRMTVCDVMEQMNEDERRNLPVWKTHLIFGYDEMLEGITLTSAVYDKYGVNNLTVFKEIRQLAIELKQYLQNDYAFIVPEQDFNQLRTNYNNLDLWHDCEDYYEILNYRSAFFKFNNVFYSTVLLYQRFIVNEIQRLLDKRKKFQVDSGFSFEKNVKKIFQYFNFEVKDIKRVKRKEFDVVCVKNNCIYNFQCKNNSIDVSQQGAGVFEKTYKGIKRLDKYYEKALSKEDGRDYLLKEKLGIDMVKNYVISRFPVITRNERIINYNELACKLAAGL